MAILESRGVAAEEGDFAIQDNSDGKGPFIAAWNEAKLGPKPTRADLDTAQAEADALQAAASKDPTDELAAAIAAAIKDEPANSRVRRLGEALLGLTGKAGRITGRPL